MKIKLTFILLVISFLANSQRFIKYDRKDFTSSTVNIYSVFVDKNDNVYAGTSHQLFRFNGLKWDSLITNYSVGSVHAITQDKTDSIRFGVINNGVYSTLDMTSVNRTSKRLLNNWVNVLKTDAQGKIWVGTNGAVSVIDGETVTNYTSENGLKGSGVNTIKIASNGNVYIGTEAGVSIYNNGNWSYLTVDSGLVSNNVKAIEIDGNGHLWIGTYDKGISKYDGKNWVVYNNANTNSSLFTDEIKDLLWDGTSMWVVGFNLAKFSFNTWTLYNSYSKDPVFPQKLASDSKGNIWISSLTAITMYNKSSETPNSVSPAIENLITFYPNPTKDNICLSGAIDNEVIDIYTMTGTLVFSSQIKDNKIDLTRLNSGSYFISLKNKKGKSIIKQIIKE